MKRSEGIVEILEAFDLAGSYRAAAELAGCSHHTVARYVRLRASGRVMTERAIRDRLIDGYLAKVEEWVERSHGKVRADVAHDKLLALGFEGSERTTRRAVAKAKHAFAAGHRRVYRPWIPEPGMWPCVGYGRGERIRADTPSRSLLIPVTNVPTSASSDAAPRFGQHQAVARAFSRPSRIRSRPYSKSSP